MSRLFHIQTIFSVKQRCWWGHVGANLESKSICDAITLGGNWMKKPPRHLCLFFLRPLFIFRWSLLQKFEPSVKKVHLGWLMSVFELSNCGTKSGFSGHETGGLVGGWGWCEEQHLRWVPGWEHLGLLGRGGRACYPALTSVFRARTTFLGSSQHPAVISSLLNACITSIMLSQKFQCFASSEGINDPIYSLQL